MAVAVPYHSPDNEVHRMKRDGETAGRMVVGDEQLLRCAITDLQATPNGIQGLDEAAERRMRLEAAVRRWAVDGVDIVQLREKALQGGDLLELARAGMAVLGEFERVPGERRTRLVVNGRADVAAAARADGVHLTGSKGELHPGQARRVFAAAGLRECFVSVSCHTVEAVVAAREQGADLVLFGPVFEKRVRGERVVGGVGLVRLREACQAAGEMPVLALGGVTAADAAACAEAGAAGVAGIRLFG